MWGHKIRKLPFDMVCRHETEFWRGADFWTKEPETIAWLDSMRAESDLWDIGANVGAYSLYATYLRVNVTAFEPMKSNFERLFLNAKVNDMTIPAYPYAFGDTSGEVIFHVPSTESGTSGGQIGAPVDEMGGKFAPAESYPVRVVTIDEMVKDLGVPNHIKIDVDGQELAILRGGINTLYRPEVRSVLVECAKRDTAFSETMTKLGFTDFNPFNGADINRRRANPRDPRCNVIWTRG